MNRALLLALALPLTACVQSTGGQIVSFDVAAAGTGAATIDNGLGWHVVLTTAKLHLGAVYLNLTVPSSGAQFTNCILPGIYTAEELSGLTVDALSTTPQPFSQPGDGTDDEARNAELWLTGGDVNADNDPTIIAELAGTASKGAEVIPFTTSITIGTNRLVQSTDPTQPSLHPICKQRIVTPIAIDFAPHDGGTLLVTIDPTAWVANVDFATVP
ncbi:MAG TPA: hypothetical protein VHE35_18575, partial [Kofleriaceae bacterium]|nr:hypothetical protein [Kofleriaceae bacterium]